jgi:hypothetical protein
MFSGSKNGQEVVQHDIRTVFQGIYEVQQALSSLFSKENGAIFITNANAAKALAPADYCLIVDRAYIELVEGSDTLQSKTKWDVGTGNIYVNQRLQEASYIMDLIRKLKGVLLDLKEKRAQMYQHC